ncbi:hypothetical protein B0H19DRAFT_1055478 [Mycena capillaripes]|nr:hypothetical protein B0H19DRAFT_1055478 [Mycena capillaripes]
MATSPTATASALPPFSGRSSAECSSNSSFIVRSSDGAGFHVDRKLLTAASPVFRSMLHGVDEKTDGEVCLELVESSDVLSKLFCLAVGDAQPALRTAEDLDGVWKIHQAAEKYQLLDARRQLESMLLDPVLIEAHPHRLFAIARLREIPALDKEAALCTLGAPVCPPLRKFPELALISADKFQNIYGFHHVCGSRAEELVERTAGVLRWEQLWADPPMAYAQSIAGTEDTGELFIWWDHGAGHSGDCGPINQYETTDATVSTQQVVLQVLPAAWFQRHIESVAMSVRITPSADAAEEAALDLSPFNLAAVSACSACSRFAMRDLAIYASQLRNAVNNSNLEVCFDLGLWGVLNRRVVGLEGCLIRRLVLVHRSRVKRTHGVVGEKLTAAEDIAEK